MAQLVFLAVIVVLAVTLVSRAIRRSRRREGLFLFATAHGLEFSRSDPMVVLSHAFHLFTLGARRGCENVMAGRWEGLAVKGADYWYRKDSSDRNKLEGSPSRRMSIVVAELPCTVPLVRIERARVGAVMIDRLLFDPVPFESEEFNRQFRVVAADREFAFRLIDARMMGWLLSTPQDLSFEVEDSSVLVYSPLRRPEAMLPLFACAKRFVDHIPSLVRTEFG